MEDLEHWMLAAAALVLLAILTSKLAVRTGIPVVVLFLALGMLAGSDGPGNIEFTDFDVARNVGVVALAYILFAGGFGTPWSDVRLAVRPAAVLATIGVVITAALTGAFATWVTDLSWREGLLLGAIVSSTDAAAVFSVLRGRSVGIPRRTRALLEVESGGNDPMAAFLTIEILAWIVHDELELGTLLLHLVGEVAFGLGIGVAGGLGLAWALRRLRLEHDGLYPVLTLAGVALTYAGAAAIGGSGFLAVYVAGLVLGRANVVHRRSLMRFHDAVAWIMQIAMFLVLGLLVFPSDLGEIAWRALAITAVLVLVARPIAVGISLIGNRFPVREQALVSWLGLRGAVPIVLATFPEAEGLSEAQTIFNIVFFVVVTSVLVQGTTLTPIARRLGLQGEAEDHADFDDDALHELVIAAGSRGDGRAVVDLGLPDGVLLVLLARQGEQIVPQGSTVILGGDRLLFVADDEGVSATRALLSGD
jgi:cell volume regulation protein A